MTQGRFRRMDVIHALLHPGSSSVGEVTEHIGQETLLRTRKELFGVAPPQAEEARKRYAWVRQVMNEVQSQAPLLAKFSARVLRDVPSATTTLPSAALGPAGGGRFLTDPGDPDGLAVINEVFLLDLALPPELAQAPFGARVFVRFDHGYEPAGLQIWRRMRQLFLRTLNA